MLRSEFEVTAERDRVALRNKFEAERMPGWKPATPLELAAFERGKQSVLDWVILPDETAEVPNEGN